MSDLDALDARERALEGLLAQWRAGILDLMRVKLADAEAHATKALTDALKATPDGRATIRRANQSPSYQAAVNRLDELLAILAGPSRASLEGRLRNAAQAFYAASYASWRRFIPDELWARPDGVPTAAELAHSRRLVVHGVDLRTELEGPFEQAGRRLLAVLAQAGARSTPEHVASDLVTTWRRQTEGGFAALLSRVLSDWQKAADTQAGRDLVHPDWHDTSPIEP